MKVCKRSIPLDHVAVEQGGKLIAIHTHHHQIWLCAYDEQRQTVASHEFTFPQLYQLLQNLKPGIADLCTPP